MGNPGEMTAPKGFEAFRGASGHFGALWGASGRRRALRNSWRQTSGRKKASRRQNTSPAPPHPASATRVTATTTSLLRYFATSLHRSLASRRTPESQPFFRNTVQCTRAFVQLKGRKLYTKHYVIARCNATSSVVQSRVINQ